MIKYSFLIHHDDYHQFLDELKHLGVLHIIEHDREPTPTMLNNLRKIKEINQLVKSFENQKTENQTPVNEITDGETLIDTWDEARKNKDQAIQQLGLLQKEVSLLMPWGQFDRDNLSKMYDAGLKVLLYTIPVHHFKDVWLEQHPIEIINDVDGVRYFAVIVPYFSTFELPEAEDAHLPEKSLFEAQAEIESTQKNIEQLEKQMVQMANGGVTCLREYASKLQNAVALEHAQLHTLEHAEGAIKMVEGWVPVTAESLLQQLINKSDVYALKGEKVSPDEKPPILLRNNWFSKLFEPIGKLYSLPGYAELDLTPFFAPFFMMFFGFCFGDAGYGILIIFAAVIAKVKLKKEYKPIATLMIWLSSAAVIFGSITGTFFGAKLTDIQVLEGLKQYLLSDQQMFNLALSLGVIQIVFGMTVKVFNISRQNGFKYSFSTIGWILVIVSSIAMYIGDIMDPAKGWMMGKLHLIILGIAGLGIFVLNNPKRNVLINIGAGIWDSYNMVTGIAGDVLSYIRLFALGLSSGILGMVFNQLAFNLSPDVPVLGQIITALILLFGHSLNIFMSVLGSFVHPMRLTFVEFYKNAGFNGGGKAYSPFKKIN